MNFSKFERRVLGHIGVDAGIVWIGDPCYILHRDEGGVPDSLGSNWVEFCALLEKKNKNGAASFAHKESHARFEEGLGVCTSTYYGDGVYPVIGFFRKGEMRPVFIVVDFNNEFHD